MWKKKNFHKKRLIFKILRTALFGFTFTGSFITSMFTALYSLIWHLHEQEWIDSNIFHSLYGAGQQWTGAIYNMDIPGLPLRFFEGVILHYFHEDRFNPEKWCHLLGFTFLAIPFIYFGSTHFSVFNAFGMPFFLTLFLIDPSLFAEIETGGFTFWELLFGNVSFTPKEGLPALLVQADAMQSIMWGFPAYLQDDWVPKIDSYTFKRLWLNGIVQVHLLGCLFIPMLIWAFGSVSIMSAIFTFDVSLWLMF